MKPAQKLKILNFFDDSIKREEKTDLIVINNLVRSFKKISFAKEYSRNLLKAFKLDAKKKDTKTGLNSSTTVNIQQILLVGSLLIYAIKKKKKTRK